MARPGRRRHWAWLWAAAPLLMLLTWTQPGGAAATGSGGGVERSQSDRVQALAAFSRGMAESSRGQSGPAQADLERAARFEPVRDAATAALVRYLYQHRDWQGALEAAKRYPIAADDYFYDQIALDAAQSANNLSLWPEVLEWTKNLSTNPAGIYLRAAVEAASGQTKEAARLERELVYRYPKSWSGKHVLAAWHRHLQAMPDLAPDWKLIAQRAAALDRARDHKTAALDWAWAAREAPAKNKPELEMAEARSERHAGKYARAWRLVRKLRRGPERAQALEFEIELARAKGTQSDFAAPLKALRKEFPHSPWYAMALDQAGNSAVIAADGVAIQKYFDRLVEAFPDSGYAPAAAWHATWVSYREDHSDAPQRLERYARAYPDTAAAVDALYWRGVWAARHGDRKLAAACFRAAAIRYPGKYFGQQAQIELTKLGGKPNQRSTPKWLTAYFDDAPTPKAKKVTGQEQKDAERARWLSEAGLNGPAEVILKGVLQQQQAGEASLAVARQLAAIEDEEENWYGGIAAMVRGVPHYLELQTDQLPVSDWKRLFPAPYQKTITAAAKRERIDPNLLRALIRQESGFNPQAESGVAARGLMQLMLATARGLGGRHLRASDLWKPEVNIRLGSRFFHHLLNRFDEPAYALAGYNAGGSRVVAWQQTYQPHDVNEFIESIPFSETRSYVRAVLRNAAHYAAIYGH